MVILFPEHGGCEAPRPEGNELSKTSSHLDLEAQCEIRSEQTLPFLTTHSGGKSFAVCAAALLRIVLVILVSEGVETEQLCNKECRRLASENPNLYTPVNMTLHCWLLWPLNNCTV